MLCICAVNMPFWAMFQAGAGADNNAIIRNIGLGGEAMTSIAHIRSWQRMPLDAPLPRELNCSSKAHSWRR